VPADLVPPAAAHPNELTSGSLHVNRIGRGPCGVSAFLQKSAHHAIRKREIRRKLSKKYWSDVQILVAAFSAARYP
jgi:hypothetical protein